VDGPEARAWTAGHDVIDRRMLDRALSGVPAADTARVREACARWRRVRVAVDATSYPRPDAWCSPGREHVHHGACHCRGSSKTTPGWEYPARRRHRVPAHRLGSGRRRAASDCQAGFHPRWGRPRSVAVTAMQRALTVPVIAIRTGHRGWSACGPDRPVRSCGEREQRRGSLVAAGQPSLPAARPECAPSPTTAAARQAPSACAADTGLVTS